MGRVVILLGAPGAGKGTQAAQVSASLGLAHISTGDLFRENLAQETELGKKAKGFMESGKLVPDELVLEMLFDRVGRPDCEEGYILDGFPRTTPQATAYDERLGESHELRAINIEVRDEKIVERASGRLLCRSCTNIQHKAFKPPATEGVCDACGGELYQRKDDSPDVVQERLRVYHEETAPLVELYSELGVLLAVDGESSPDQVFESIMTLLGEGGDA